MKNQINQNPASQVPKTYADPRIEAIRNDPADPKLCWYALHAAIIILSALISLVITYYFEKGLGVAAVIFITAAIILAVITRIMAWEVVPENHEYIIELNGKYMATWKPGPHFAFPFFGFMKLRAVINMAETRCHLFANSLELIDFHDASTKISASIHFKVTDSLKAVYAIDDYEASLVNRMEGALRAACGLYSLDEANRDKHILDFPAVIIHYEEVEKIKNDSENKSKFSGKFTNDQRLKLLNLVCEQVARDRDKYTTRDFYREISEGWGLEISKLTVSDIDIPDDIKKARQKKLEAEEAYEAAQFERETALLKAKVDYKVKVTASEAQAKGIELVAGAEAKALEVKGAALSKQISSLVSEGKITPQEAKEMIESIKKWESLGDKTVILENSMPDSMSKRFIELGILAQTGSNIVK